MSSTYLSYLSVGFNGAVSEAEVSKYSMHRFAITGDNGEPIADHSSSWQMSDSSWKYVVNISIRLSTGMLVCSLVCQYVVISIGFKPLPGLYL